MHRLPRQPTACGQYAHAILTQAADPDCPQCGGAGRTEATSTIPMPGLITPDRRQDQFVITSTAIFPCVPAAVQKQQVP